MRGPGCARSKSGTEHHAQRHRTWTNSSMSATGGQYRCSFCAIWMVGWPLPRRGSGTFRYHHRIAHLNNANNPPDTFILTPTWTLLTSTSPSTYDMDQKGKFARAARDEYPDFPGLLCDRPMSVIQTPWNSKLISYWTRDESSVTGYKYANPYTSLSFD